jgi:hypothetical protein
MDKNLKMVAKAEPNVAFIIQRSNVSDQVVLVRMEHVLTWLGCLLR